MKRLASEDISYSETISKGKGKGKGKAEDNNYEIELVTISSSNLSDVHLPRGLWNKVLFYVKEMRELGRLMRVCKIFREVIVQGDDLWRPCVTFMRTLYENSASSALIEEKKIAAMNTRSYRSEYERLLTYARAMYENRRKAREISARLAEEEVETAKKEEARAQRIEERERTQRKVMRLTPPVFAMVIPYLVYYIFFILLALQVSGAIDIPYYPYLILCTFMMGYLFVANIYAYYAKTTMTRIIRRIIRWNKYIFLGFFWLPILLLFFFAALWALLERGHTQNTVYALALGGGLSLLLVLCLLLSFKCTGMLFKGRYSIGFKGFAVVSFLSYIGGVSLLVYTSLYGLKHNFDVAAGILLFVSFALWVFYFTVVSCCVKGHRCSPLFYALSLLEIIVGGTIFGTTAMVYLNSFRDHHLPWGVVFLPMFFFPIFFTVMCGSYIVFQDSRHTRYSYGGF